MHDPIAGSSRQARTAPLPAARFALIVLTLAYVAPIWCYRFLPTCDGPAHVYNALMLKDFRTPGSRYHEFYEHRPYPSPNLTAHLVLAGLMHLLPPLAAEKTLVTIYVMGLPVAFGYFLGAVSPSARGWTVAALLVTYNRCLLLGFYNYCLSVVLLFLVLGWCLRRTGPVTLAEGVALSLLALASYFTHLVGFALLIVSLMLVSLMQPAGWRRLTLTAAATILPVLPFLAHFAWATEWFDRDTALRVVDDFWWGVRRLPARFADELAACGKHLFGAHDRSGGWLGAGALLWLEAAALAGFAAPLGSSENRTGRCALARSVALLAAVVAGLYLVLPDSFGPHGGFLKPRLALVAPLVAVACFAPAPRAMLRRLLLVLLYGLACVNLLFVHQHFRAANHVIAEFTAGIQHVGENRTVRAVGRPADTQKAGYLGTAGAYYCLENGNVWLDNYEARKRHFPFRFRSGADPRDLPAEPEPAEVLVIWESSADSRPRFPPGCRECFHRGRLWICGK